MARLAEENARLVAVQRGLQLELGNAQEDLGRYQQTLHALQADKDSTIRALLDKTGQMEAELRAIEPLRAELQALRAEVQHRAESEAMLQQDLRQLQGELDALPHARAALETEKAATAEAAEVRAGLEKSLVAMARDLERLLARGQLQESVPPMSAGDFEAAGAHPDSSRQWAEHLAPDGKPFYFNAATGITQWEKPPEMVAQQFAQNAKHGLHHGHVPYIGSSSSPHASSPYPVPSPQQQLRPPRPQQEAQPLQHTYPTSGPPQQQQYQQQQSNPAARSSAPPAVQPHGNQLFVFGLPDNFVDQELADLFSPRGAVNTAKMGVDKKTGRTRGFGFVTMASSADAERALAGIHNTVLAGRTLKVEHKRKEDKDASDQPHHHYQNFPNSQQQRSGGRGYGPARQPHRQPNQNGYRPY
eukprot:SM000135S27003  [mRNA]  locus=s135:135917:139757:- [translate_table: standard]